MAKGRNAWRNRLLLILALSTYVLLVVAEIAPNPLPGIWEWVDRERPLAADLAWQHRLGSRPASAVVVGDTVVVEAGTSTQLRRTGGDGDPVPVEGGEDWNPDWLVVAGSGADAVVISSRPDGGYQVRNLAGRLLHEDEGAVAVWGFRNGWLDLRCGDARACQLRRFQASSGPAAPVWTTALPGERSGTLGANPQLAAARDPAPSRIHSGVSGPGPLPPLIGLPVQRDGEDAVLVIRTATGQILQELVPAEGERITVIGGRVVRSRLAQYGGVCVSSVSGHDAVTGSRVWGPESHHVWNTDGYGCEPRVAPLGAGQALTAVRADGRPMVIDAYDGRVLWIGERGERVADLSPELAVIRATDRTTRYVVALGGDGSRLWERKLDPDAGVTLASCGVVASDRDPDRVYVWEPRTGDDRLATASSGRILACAQDGLLLADGRSIGFARFAEGRPASDGNFDEPLEQK